MIGLSSLTIFWFSFNYERIPFRLNIVWLQNFATHLQNFIRKVRERRQSLLLVLSQFKRINELLFPLTLEYLCFSDDFRRNRSSLVQIHLTLSWRGPLPYRNQSIDLQSNWNLATIPNDSNSELKSICILEK